MVNTIILYDKSNAERMQLTTVFRGRGFDVIGVNNSVDLLLKASKYDPDIVMISFANTDQDYLDAVRSVKMNDKINHLPVVLAFQQDHPELMNIIDDAKKMGVDGYLFKPFDFNFAVVVVRDIQRLKGNPGRKKIIVADDHQSMRDALTFALNKEGYNVFIAENGRDVYEKARQLVPDAILMDYNMPECSGLYSAKRIKEVPYLKDTIIMGHTAAVDADILARSLTAGIATVFKKPMPISEMLVKIKSLME